MRYSIIENGAVANQAEASVEFAASKGWIAAGDSRLGDTWDGVKFSPPVKILADEKSALLLRLAELAEARLVGGTIINGLKVSTDADAKGLLALGKIGNKVSRKVVTSYGQEAILTTAQFDSLVAGVDNFGQGVMDRHYDLRLAIKATTTLAELQAIDITTGWPA